MNAFLNPHELIYLHKYKETDVTMDCDGTKVLVKHETLCRRKLENISNDPMWVMSLPIRIVVLLKY